MCHAIFQSKSWIVGGTVRYQMMEWWKKGNDKMEKKEETKNRPLEEGDQSKVSGLEGLS